tara:strand:- start:3685 stop:4584 length:900 start_codon:yes stop_codon:yes gene_type:complete
MSIRPPVICIGSVLWDIIGRTQGAVRERGDVAGRITRLPGGVAMNIAMTLAKLGMAPIMLTALGRDFEGQELLSASRELGLNVDYVHQSNDLPTDTYMAIEDSDGVVAAIADAHGLEAAGDAVLAPLSDGRLASAAAPWDGLIVLDGNLTRPVLAQIAASALFARATLCVAPASPGKAERLWPVMHHPRSTLYVNLHEARLLCDRPFASSAEAAQGLVRAGATRALVTDGARDASDAAAGRATVTLPARVVAARRVTGAGDTFMAAHIFAESAGASPPEALTRAQAAAAAYVAFEDTAR